MPKFGVLRLGKLFKLQNFNSIRLIKLDFGVFGVKKSERLV